MALIRTVGPDGVVNYRQDPLDPSKPVVLTGPVKGDITLSDGKVYNVSDDYIEVDSHEHAGELSHHIGVRHEEEGHPSHVTRGHENYNPLVDEFHHVCTASCGSVARTAKQAAAAFNDRLNRLGHGHLVGTDAHAERQKVLASAHQAHNEKKGS